MTYEAAGDASLGLGSSDVSPILSVPLPEFTHRTLVRVMAFGGMSTTLTEFNDGGPGSPPAPGAPRSYGPGGYFWGTSSFSGCGTAIYVYYSQGDAWSPGCAENRSTDTVIAANSHIYAQGLGSASRTVTAPATSGSNDCFTATSGWGPCFRYSTGGQTVTLERVVVNWGITASPTTVLTGDSVTFTVSWGPDSVAGKALPFELVNVRWIRLSDGQPETVSPPCTWNQFSQTSSTTLRCRGKVFSSGWMEFTARANGLEETQTTYVSAIQCLIDFGDPADSILNDARIRKQLGIAWTRSKPDTIPSSLRREHLGIRYQLSDGTIHDTTFTVLPGATPCQSFQIGWTLPPGFGITLLMWHTHPFDIQPTNDTLPDNCGIKDPSNPPGTKYYNAAGPSSHDYMGFPFLVIDKKNVYWVKDGLTKKPKTKKRQQCDATQYGF